MLTSPSTRPDVISLADEERVNDVVLGAVLALWDVVNNLTRLQPSRRDRYRVTIFGSARATPGSFGYEETRRAAAMLAAMGVDIATGVGPGRMRAANRERRPPQSRCRCPDVSPGLSHVRRAIHPVRFPSPLRGIALRSVRNPNGLAPSSVSLQFVTPGAARLMHDQPLRKTPHAVEA